MSFGINMSPQRHVGTRNDPQASLCSLIMSWTEHSYSQRRLDRFVDDELPGNEVDRFTGHLIACPECSAGVRLLLRVRASLRGMEAEPEVTQM